MTQEAPYINDYDNVKMVKHGNTHSGIPTPDQQKTYFIGELFLLKK